MEKHINITLPYLEQLPNAKEVTLLQLQKVCSRFLEVYIKPGNHKTYWSGEFGYLPKDMYDFKIMDISVGRKSLKIFVEFNEKWDQLADEKELEAINEYYKFES